MKSRKTDHSNDFFYLKLFICIVIASISVLYANAQAQTKGATIENSEPQKTVKGNTYSIIFGVSNYPGLTPLKYADKDAQLFRDFLETPAGGNTKPENIFFRTNENAKAADFNVDAYTWLKRKALKEGDRLYIYFSGHGDAMNEDNYFLLPYDCTPNNDVNNYLATGRIEMYHVKTLFIKPLIAKKVEVLLIVDACRTNDLPGGQQGQQNFVNYVQSIAEQKEGEIIMLSTGAGQSAIESAKIGNGHGLFTWYLVAGLSGDADKEGDAADHDGKVSLAEITSYVKNRVRRDAKSLFGTNQVPVFLPPDKDLETIAMVDSGTYANWKLAENMLQQTNGGGNMMAVVSKKPGKKAVTQGSIADTALIAIDNKFITAIKAGKLSGKNSAEGLYNEMAEKWPGESITEDAKYSLATEFINFGQEKINLFLSGKGIVHIQHMENQFKIEKKDSLETKPIDGGKALSKSELKRREFKPGKPGPAGKTKDSITSMPPGIAEQIIRMKTLATTGFDRAAEMMGKAVKLLNNDPELLEPIYPKLYFLKAASYVNDNSNIPIIKTKQAIDYIKKAISKDSTAAYNFLILGHLLQNLKNDSSEVYYKKTIQLAPKWANPENGLGNYYSDKHQNDRAILHYHKALKLDSLDDIVYQNIGVLYRNLERPDSAKKYYLKALTINPCDSYANANLGYFYKDSLTYRDSTDNPHFKLSEKYFKKAFQCDSTNSFAYQGLAELFTKVNDRDSAISYLKLGILKNPNDASLHRNLAGEYFNKSDTLKAEFYYKKALSADSLDLNNYFSLGGFYAGIHSNSKAALYYNKAIKAEPRNASPYNEFANYYVDIHKPDSAILLYHKGLKYNSSLPYLYYNIGRVYNYEESPIKIDSSIYYYERAFNLDSIGYKSLKLKLADLYERIGNNRMSIFYYRKCLNDNGYNYTYLQAIVDQLIKTSQYNEAESIVRTYMPANINPEKEYYYVYKEYVGCSKLIGSIYLASGKYKEAETWFIRALGLTNPVKAKNYQELKSFPYPLQNRLPDREGLVTAMYSDQFSYLKDSVVQHIVDEKVVINRRYLFPFAQALSLSDIDANMELIKSSNFVRLWAYSDPEITDLRDSKFLHKIVETNSKVTRDTAYLSLVLSVIDNYDSYSRNYKTPIIKYHLRNILPINYYQSQKRFGARILQDYQPHKNPEALIKGLTKLLKSDSLNTRIYVEIADLHLQIMQNYIGSYNSQITQKPVKEQIVKLLDSAITDNYQKAIFNYKKAIKTDQSFEVVSFCRMGDFYMQAGQSEEAKKCYYHSIQADSSFIYPYAKLANYYYQNLNLDSSLYLYKKLSKRDTLFQPFYDVCVSRLHEKNNDIKKALDLNLAGFNKYHYQNNTYFPGFCINLTRIYADVLHYPKGSDDFFIKCAQSNLNNGQDYYWHLIKYACKWKQNDKALLYFERMLQSLRLNDISQEVVGTYYTNLVKEPYCAVIVQSPEFKNLLEKYHPQFQLATR